MKGFTSLPNVPGWTVGFGFGASSATEAAAESGWIVRIPEITNQMRLRRRGFIVRFPQRPDVALPRRKDQEMSWDVLYHEGGRESARRDQGCETVAQTGNHQPRT